MAEQPRQLRRLLLCDCGKSMDVDGPSLARACQMSAEAVSHELCRAQISRFEAALADNGDLTVACTQEAPVFTEIAEEAGAGERVSFVDIRDRAGWSKDGDATAKMAALIAEAGVLIPPTPGLTLRSEGVALVYGPAEHVFSAARRVADRLAVTVMISDDEEAAAPVIRDFPIVRGRVAAARGTLGGFELTVDGFAQASPSGRGPLSYSAPQNGVKSECDLIVDLSGADPLFPAGDRRDGYLRADPRDPAAVSNALLEATALVGEFEKPLYVNLDESLCAHRRSGQPGCDRCLQVCPTSAITPNGDTVAIDPKICAGCGACATVCPSGAATYAFPEPVHLIRRLEALLSGWQAAGGGAARLLVHGASGAETIAYSGRFGAGLPTDAVPFAVNQVTQIGHETMLAALAMGFNEVILLADPKYRDEYDALRAQVRLTNILSEGAGIAGERARLIETLDPEALEAELDGDSPPPAGVEPVTPIGGRRSVTRQAMAALAAAGSSQADAIPLPGDLYPSGAPYGRVVHDAEACTLCHACVSVCPAGALLDDPDAPKLRFLEDACLQCGICRSTCPEDAIRLEARYLVGDAARRPILLKEEEPFACIECGKPFGVKSSIERIATQLGGKHWMYADDSRTRLIQMCNDCRVRAQYHAENNPFRFGERPRVRTTDDYLGGKFDTDESDG